MRDRPASRGKNGSGVPAWAILAGGGAALALVGIIAVVLALSQ